MVLVGITASLALPQSTGDLTTSAFGAATAALTRRDARSSTSSSIGDMLSSDFCPCGGNLAAAWPMSSKFTSSENSSFICIDGAVYLTSFSTTSSDVVSPAAVTCRPIAIDETSSAVADAAAEAGAVTPGNHHLWALVLLLFPALTVFGNMLVVLSVFRERNLRTATNYFIVSLAVADIMVAILVMPLAVYVEVRRELV
jgi:hypothetical protein